MHTRKGTRPQTEKTPTSRDRGQAPRLRHWHLSPRKAPQSKTKQVSWLTAHTYSPHLPKGASLSGLCRFRSAHSCGAAIASHHLPCSQRLSCEATWLSSTSKLFLYPIVISSMLSRAIMRCPCAHATMVHSAMPLCITSTQLGLLTVLGTEPAGSHKSPRPSRAPGHQAQWLSF